MGQNLEKVKTHLRENKKIYFACGGTAIVAVVGTAVVMLRTKTLVNNQQIQVLAYKSKQTLEVYIEALGDPGNIIQETTNGVDGPIYASQGQTAKALGVTPSAISQHLSGKSPHVKGHTFKKLGKAMVSAEEV